MLVTLTWDVHLYVARAKGVRVGAMPCALAGHSTLAVRRCPMADQWLPPPLASTNFRITASRLKEAGF